MISVNDVGSARSSSTLGCTDQSGPCILTQVALLGIEFQVVLCHQQAGVLSLVPTSGERRSFLTCLTLYKTSSACSPVYLNQAVTRLYKQVAETSALSQIRSTTLPVRAYKRRSEIASRLSRRTAWRNRILQKFWPPGTFGLPIATSVKNCCNISPSTIVEDFIGASLRLAPQSSV